MRYMVPQFINREARVWGSLTFKQTIVIGSLLILSVILYYALPPKIFILVVPGIGIIAIALLFVKVEGRSLLATLTSYIWFFFSPKTYIWKRKKFFPGIITPKKTNQKNKTSISPLSPSLKIVDKGHLKDLYNKINLKAVNVKK